MNASSADSRSVELELVTWNLNGLDERAIGPRTEAALQEILLGARIDAIVDGRAPRDPPHVLLFQEVTRTSFHALLRPHLEAAGFVLRPDRPPDRSYFELCAVRPPWSLLEHRTEPLWRSYYGRWQHELAVARGGQRWRILTAHLDSGPEPGTAEARLAQTKDLARQLAEGPAVFAGDTNLREAEWKEVAGQLSLIDAWEAAGASAEHRFTWSSGPRRARFDRIWVSRGVEVLTFERIGTDPVARLGLTPSDHLGLRARLRLLPT